MTACKVDEFESNEIWQADLHYSTVRIGELKQALPDKECPQTGTFPRVPSPRLQHQVSEFLNRVDNDVGCDIVDVLSRSRPRFNCGTRKALFAALLNDLVGPDPTRDDWNTIRSQHSREGFPLAASVLRHHQPMHQIGVSLEYFQPFNSLRRKFIAVLKTRLYSQSGRTEARRVSGVWGFQHESVRASRPSSRSTSPHMFEHREIGARCLLNSSTFE